jgi:hypothetical protein
MFRREHFQGNVFPLSAFSAERGKNDKLSVLKASNDLGKAGEWMVRE